MTDKPTNQVKYRIVDTKTGRGIEQHPTPWAANRAYLILLAHERKNGRSTQYRIEPPIPFLALQDLGLPGWVLENLTTYAG